MIYDSTFFFKVTGKIDFGFICIIKILRKLLLNLTCILSSTIFSLGIVEILIRLLGVAPQFPLQYSNFVTDPFIFYRPKPYSILSGKTDEYEFEFKINSMGFRDVEHSWEKPKNTYRILALGDSFTYGIGVKFEETFLYLLEKMLNEKSSKFERFEIIKAGVPRYFPQTERLLLQHYGVKYHPDLILVGFLPNDIVDTYLGIDALAVSPYGYLLSSSFDDPNGIWLWIDKYYHTGRIVLKWWLDFSKCAKERRLHKLKKWSDMYKSNGFFEKDWRKIEEEYEKIISISQAINSNIVFFHIPQKGPWDMTNSYPAIRLGGWAKKNKVLFIDILPNLQVASKENVLYYEKDGHCNKDGYKVIAENLYSELIKKSIIPTR